MDEVIKGLSLDRVMLVNSEVSTKHNTLVGILGYTEKYGSPNPNPLLLPMHPFFQHGAHD